MIRNLFNSFYYLNSFNDSIYKINNNYKIEKFVDFSQLNINEKIYLFVYDKKRNSLYLSTKYFPKNQFYKIDLNKISIDFLFNLKETSNILGISNGNKWVVDD